MGGGGGVTKVQLYPKSAQIMVRSLRWWFAFSSGADWPLARLSSSTDVAGEAIGIVAFSSTAQECMRWQGGAPPATRPELAHPTCRPHPCLPLQSETNPAPAAAQPAQVELVAGTCTVDIVAGTDATLPTLTEFTAETLASLVDLATPAGRLPDHALQSRALDTVAGWLPREGLPVEEIKRRALIAGVRV
jgi:hypothetical protein